LLWDSSDNRSSNFQVQHLRGKKWGEETERKITLELKKGNNPLKNSDDETPGAENE